MRVAESIGTILAGLLLLSPAAAESGFEIETVAAGIDHPWCLAFLPDGSLLVSGRSGTLDRLPPNGERVSITGVPPVFARSQGGLFDVLPAPDFARSRRLLLSYAHGNGQENALRIASARLQNDRLEDLVVIFEARPAKDTPVHYGGRLAWLPDGTILATTGDGFDYREAAQRLDNHLGKTLRLNADGTIPADNPLIATAGALPAIWTWGHRNPQGLAVDPATGVVYQHEHGPKGGDEINRLEAGTNYGWPVISFGVDYNGAYITPFTEYPGMAQPLLQWTPSIAPAGLAIYRGAMFASWQGDLLVASLAEQTLRRVVLSRSAVTNQEILLQGQGRLRDVRVGPDGAIYVLTDEENGRILRLFNTDG